MNICPKSVNQNFCAAKLNGSNIARTTKKVVYDINKSGIMPSMEPQGMILPNGVKVFSMSEAFEAITGKKVLDINC